MRLKLAFLALPILTFAGAVQTITGNQKTNSSNPSSDIYTNAINFETGKKVLEGQSTANPTSFQMFNIDVYLYSIAKLRKVYAGTKEVVAKKWKVSNNQNINTSPKLPSQTTQTKQIQPVKAFRVMGFCEFDRTIKVYGKQTMYVNIPCYLNGISGVATLFGRLEPQLNNYSLTLKPLELYTNNGIYKIKAGYVLNADRSNPNIATSINTRAIEKILARTGVDMGNAIKDTAQKIAQSKTTEIQVTGDVTVKQTNYSFSIIPQLAFWTGVASLVGNIASYFEQQTSNIPVTFTIAKGTEIFLNAIIEPENYQMQTVVSKPKVKKPNIQPIKTLY